MSKIKPGEIRNPFGRAGKKKRTHALAKRTDGWNNIYSSLGTSRDPSEATRFKGDFVLSRRELASLYRHDGFSRLIVDLPPDEMLREWIEIKGDSNGMLLKQMRPVKSMISKLLKNARLYGGAVALMLIDDGRDLAEPLSLNQIRDIVGYRVYDRHQVTWTSIHLNKDPMSVKYGEPERYVITPYTNGVQFTVHESRLIRMDGNYIPDLERQANNGWGDSVIQSVYRDLRRFCEANGWAAGIVRSFEQMTVSITGLQNMIAADQDDLVIRRMQMMELSRSLLNTIILDAEGEEFSKHSSSVSGLPELLDRFGLVLAGITGIPATKLFGRSPAGLNASGDADIQHFYDTIRCAQEDDLRDPLEKILELLCIAEGINPDDYSIVFRPLQSPSEQETVNARLGQAQTDQIYFQMGLSAQTILKSRFGGDHYSHETQIEDGDEWFEEPIDDLYESETTGDDPTKAEGTADV